jgi:pimeloyl-ACP methyl ester carboxylesterase
VAAKYADLIGAALGWFDESAHMPHLEDPALFHQALKTVP